MSEFQVNDQPMNEMAETLSTADDAAAMLKDHYSDHGAFSVESPLAKPVSVKAELSKAEKESALDAEFENVRNALATIDSGSHWAAGDAILRARQVHSELFGTKLHNAYAATKIGRGVTEQRIGQYADTAEYFPLSLRVDGVVFKTHEVARLANESSLFKRTPIEVSEIIAKYKGEKSATQKVRAAIAPNAPLVTLAVAHTNREGYCAGVSESVAKGINSETHLAFALFIAFQTARERLSELLDGDTFPIYGPLHMLDTLPENRRNGFLYEMKLQGRRMLAAASDEPRRQCMSSFLGQVNDEIKKLAAPQVADDLDFAAGGEVEDESDPAEEIRIANATNNTV